MTKPKTDAEAIAALDAKIYHDLDTVHEWLSARGYASEALACFNALNRFHKLTRRAQPTSELADGIFDRSGTGKLIRELQAQLAARDADVARLREAFNKAEQRLNESGTGEMGLIDTIHAVYAIIRAASAPIPEKPTPAHDDADLEAAHCIRYQQARELD